MNKAICLLTLFNFVSLYTQPTLEWVRTYNGPAGLEDYASGFCLDAYRNMYVTGSAYRHDSIYDFTTIKYNSSGIQQWIRNYNETGIGHDGANSILSDAAGNIYVTGKSENSSGDDDFAIIKYSPNGDVLWVKRYNGTGNGEDYPTAMFIDNSGYIYITGFSYSGSLTKGDYTTIKYDSDGNLIWVVKFNGSGNDNDYSTSVFVDDQGYVYVTGYSLENGPGEDYATVKYNSNGVQQWVRKYNGSFNNSDWALKVLVGSGGNIYVSGWSAGSGNNNLDYLTIKYNNNGDSLWVKRYDGPSHGWDWPYDMKIDNQGNVYLTGESVANGRLGYATIKYNSNGIELWVQRYESGNGKSLSVDNSGNIYVTGKKYIYNEDANIATLKYNNNGELLWVENYDSGLYDDAFQIMLDTSNNIYLLGSTVIFPSNHDYLTIKYSQTIGIQPISNDIPKNFSLLQNFPNPFNPSTQINFGLPKTSFVKLIIYDVLGREIAALINEELKAGEYSVDWNAENYPGGIYFYSMTAGDFTDTRKMALVK